MKLMDCFLRVALTAAHHLVKARWFLSRPRTAGAHAIALTPDRKVILVKLRYTAGWRLPGGGCRSRENPQDAVLRELSEEIGMISHGPVLLARQFSQQIHFKTDLSSLFVVEDVVYRPRWSWEVEKVSEASLEDLPADLAPVARSWIEALHGS